MPILIVRSEGGGEERIPLETSAVTLGRAIDADIRLQDIRLSRKHCQIVATPDGYTVVDLGSGNGTKVNGVKIAEHKLKSGDVILIGATTILFSDDVVFTPRAPSPSAKPAVPHPRPALRPASKEDIRHAEMPTQIFQKPAETSAMKGPRPPVPTDRQPGAQTPVSARPSPTSARPMGARPGASSRFLASSRKTIPTKYLLIGGGAAVVIVILIVIFTSGGPTDGKRIRDAEDTRADVEALFKVDKFRDAAARCDDGIKRIEGISGNRDADNLRKWFQGRKSECKRKIRNEEEALAACDEIETELGKITVASANMEDLRRLYERAKKLKQDFAGVTEETRKKIGEIVEKTRNAYEKASENPAADELSEVRQMVDPLVKARSYGDAIRLWNEFVTKHEGKEEAKEAKAKIEEINRFSKSLLDEIKQKAEGRSSEEKEATLKYLEGYRGKLKGTDAEQGLENLIRDISSR